MRKREDERGRDCNIYDLQETPSPFSSITSRHSKPSTSWRCVCLSRRERLSQSTIVIGVSDLAELANDTGAQSFGSGSLDRSPWLTLAPSAEVDD